MKNLTILTFNDPATFADVSIEMNNYDIDDVNYAMTNDQDYIYIGLYKNFKNIYIETVSQAIPNTVKFEYWDGAAWVKLNVLDETKSLSRPGFVTWETLLNEVEINNISKFYIRMTGTVTGVLAGTNMVFANDNDLTEKYRQINDYLGDDSTFIALHQSSRKDIVQDIRNRGNVKVSSIDGSISDLTVWDFLRPGQLRNAAAYLCLSKIFAGISDSSDGKFFQLSNSFKKKYKESLETFLLTVDKADDGVEDGVDQYESVKRARIVYV